MLDRVSLKLQKRVAVWWNSKFEFPLQIEHELYRTINHFMGLDKNQKVHSNSEFVDFFSWWLSLKKFFSVQNLNFKSDYFSPERVQQSESFDRISRRNLSSAEDCSFTCKSTKRVKFPEHRSIRLISMASAFAHLMDSFVSRPGFLFVRLQIQLAVPSQWLTCPMGHAIESNHFIWMWFTFNLNSSTSNCANFAVIPY